jgi:hypothetical protein
MWQNAIFQTLTLLLLACSSLSTNPFCPICGWGMMVTDPDDEVFIPTYGTFTCELLETRSQEGNVPQQNCLALQMFSRRKCGCEPEPPPTPSPVTPTQPPTAAPIALRSPSAAPSTSSPRHEILEGLSIQLTGIPELPGRSIQEWVIITESFISNFFSIADLAVLDLETKISVTGVIGVPTERRYLRQLQEPSFVTVFYTQEFMYRTTDDETVDAAYLATMPFAEAIGRESCSILLHDSGVEVLTSVMELSPVEISKAALPNSRVGVGGQSPVELPAPPTTSPTRNSH